jgi:uncharacterized surface protein with fasciclin (FAS1) repeats
LPGRCSAGGVGGVTPPSTPLVCLSLRKNQQPTQEGSGFAPKTNSEHDLRLEANGKEERDGKERTADSENTQKNVELQKKQVKYDIVQEKLSDSQFQKLKCMLLKLQQICSLET